MTSVIGKTNILIFLKHFAQRDWIFICILTKFYFGTTVETVCTNNNVVVCQHKVQNFSKINGGKVFFCVDVTWNDPISNVSVKEIFIENVIIW